MLSWLGKATGTCFSRPSRFASTNRDDDEVSAWGEDPLLWSKDLQNHSFGEFSIAVAQANENLEDYSQVETGRHATFVGVYDGHGGIDAAKYVCENLCNNLIGTARQNRATISEDIINAAFYQTESSFLGEVRAAFGATPLIASMGSCCLVGVVWRRSLYVANLGDSRAVMGSLDRWKRIVAEQLSQEHNASMEEVRDELKRSHPNDPQIVLQRQGVWRVKGIIQVSRSIGDAYLKSQEFALGESFPKYHLPQPIQRAVLRDDPSIIKRQISRDDKFVIFASDGLWEFLSNQEAVEIVHKNRRAGIAKRLLVSALTKAARVLNVPPNDIKRLANGARRGAHDDISIVVLFIDHEKLGDNTGNAPQISVKGFVDTVGPSNFNFT